MPHSRLATAPLLAPLLAALLAACGGSADPVPARIVSGPVEFLDLEGGCLVFHGDDGVDYNLFARPEVELDGVYENGAFLEVELVERADVGGYCPGRIAEVLRILSASLPLRGHDDLVLLRVDEAGETRWYVQPAGGR